MPQPGQQRLQILGNRLGIHAIEHWVGLAVQLVQVEVQARVPRVAGQPPTGRAAHRVVNDGAPVPPQRVQVELPVQPRVIRLPDVEGLYAAARAVIHLGEGKCPLNFRDHRWGRAPPVGSLHLIATVERRIVAGRDHHATRRPVMHHGKREGRGRQELAGQENIQPPLGQRLRRHPREVRPLEARVEAHHHAPPARSAHGLRVCPRDHTHVLVGEVLRDDVAPAVRSESDGHLSAHSGLAV